MNRKKLARVGSLAMSVLMVGAMLASPVFAADNDPVLVTTKGTLTIGDANYASHEYAVIKVLDKYCIQEAVAAQPAVGEPGDADYQPAVPAQEAMYQYKLNPKFGDVDTITFGIFTVDAKTGKITYMAGDPAQAVVLDDTNGSALGSNENQSFGAKFATAVAQYCVSNNIAADYTLKGNETQTEVPAGYYVIYETKNESEPNDGVIATKPVLVNLEGDALITPKPSTVELDKIINDDDAVAQDGDPQELNDYNIGDIVPYQVTTNLPIYEADVDVNSLYFQVKDELSAGLTLQTTGDNAPAVVVTDGGSAVELAEGDVTITTSGNKLVVDFAKAFIKAHQGADITITYAAELNASAVIFADGNPNEAVVEYMNNPEASEGHKTLEDDAKVYTYAIDFIKIDGTHEDLLAGATFQLSNADGVIGLVDAGTADGGKVQLYRPAVAGDAAADIMQSFVTFADKEIRFIGLDAGTYSLEELEAPQGFSLIKGALSFTITAESQAAQAETTDPETGDVIPAVPAIEMTGEASIASQSSNLIVLEDGEPVDVGVNDEGFAIDLQVKNYEGISLPETGAMTAIGLTAVGAAVVGGGLFFGLRKKKEEDEE